MAGWIVIKMASYYGPFPTRAAAAAWAEKKLGDYIGGGWCIAELWNPKKVDG